MNRRGRISAMAVAMTTLLIAGPALAQVETSRQVIPFLPEGPASVTRVRITCAVAGKPTVMNLVQESPSRLAVYYDAEDCAPRTVLVPPLTPAEVVGKQLSDRERDPVFRESMAVAAQMAQGMLK